MLYSTGESVHRDDLFSARFVSASRDYVNFLERGYAEKPLLKLVGDHHGLTRRQRHILFRGFSTIQDSLRRRSRLSQTITGSDIVMDGYNIILTVLNHLLGNPVFICSDGILRDVGENHGQIRDKGRFYRAMELIISWLAVQAPASVLGVFDSPVSHSAEHALALQTRLRQHGIRGEIELARSADYVIKHCRTGAIATSDSVIIDATTLPVVDIPRLTLESAFSTNFPDLSLFSQFKTIGR
jgi:hypothetical protein